MGRGKRPLILSFPFPSSYARFLFFSPQPSFETKRPLRTREGGTKVNEQFVRAFLMLDAVEFKFYSSGGVAIPHASYT